jgi:hypothetical protein
LRPQQTLMTAYQLYALHVPIMQQHRVHFSRDISRRRALALLTVNKHLATRRLGRRRFVGCFTCNVRSCSVDRLNKCSWVCSWYENDARKHALGEALSESRILNRRRLQLRKVMCQSHRDRLQLPQSRNKLGCFTAQ